MTMTELLELEHESRVRMLRRCVQETNRAIGLKSAEHGRTDNLQRVLDDLQGRLAAELALAVIKTPIRANSTETAS
jgi:hypothetical protein